MRKEGLKGRGFSRAVRQQKKEAALAAEGMRPKREPVRHNQQTYMVGSQTFGRRNLFQKQPWVELFLKVLYLYRGTEYLLHCFVVMPEHFHLLITPTGSLERAVQCIKGGFSFRTRKELGSSMEVWQKGFSDHRIRDAQDLTHHIQYIHMNPVRRGLCSRPEDYPYSSASGKFELDPVPQRLKPRALGAAYGAAEAAPLQRSLSAKSYSKATPVQGSADEHISDEQDDVGAIE